MTALRPEPGAQPGQDPEPDWGPFFADESSPVSEPGVPGESGETLRLRAPAAPPPSAPSTTSTASASSATGGRAARLRGVATPPPPVTGGRAARRRAAKARKDGPGIIAVRVFGELLITLGAVMILFVAYQLWWTNVRADDYAQGQASTLENQWGGGGSTTKSHPPYPNSEPAGTKFAIIYIPKLDVKTPIAEGTDKESILDNGLVGHYTGSQETAFPWAASGNFALAGHRNTHGEPFRYIPRLVPGDKIVVETAYDWYTYQVTGSLPQTSPNNVSVIAPVPPQSGFTGPGRYITLTTCTPEFTSTYRMAVWGKLVEDLPKSAGRMPAALAG